MVTNVYVKFNYHRLRTDKALGNFRKYDNSNKNSNKNNATLFQTAVSIVSEAFLPFAVYFIN